MRKTREIKIKAHPNFAVLVDGDTEVWYFQMLKRNERKINVNIEPKIPQRKRLSEQFEMVSNLSEDYTKVFWIVDLDAVIKETREAKKGKETPLQAFRRYRNILSDSGNNVVIIVNNPCLEFWILLHFEKTSRSFEGCPSVEKQLKNYLKDYEKSKKYYTKEDHDIYLKLKPFLNTAIGNAASLGSFNEYKPDGAICEMNLFFSSSEIEDHFI